METWEDYENIVRAQVPVPNMSKPSSPWWGVMEDFLVGTFEE